MEIDKSGYIYTDYETNKTLKSENIFELIPEIKKIHKHYSITLEPIIYENKTILLQVKGMYTRGIIEELGEIKYTLYLYT